MSLPPIITNSSLYKVISGTQEKGKKAAAGPEESAVKQSGPGDKVELSPAALKKLDEMKGGIDTQGQARKTAGETRAILSQNTSVNLGDGLQNL